MNLKNKLISYRRVLINHHAFLKICNSKMFKNECYVAELIRATHSIEKGLCIHDFKKGFGKEKIKSILKILPLIDQKKDDFSNDAVKMSVDALTKYVLVHEKLGFETELISQIKSVVSKYNHQELHYSNVLTYHNESKLFDVESIERFFYTRHSIRDFEASNIDYSSVIKAIHLAQTAPSACNRQAVRVYILSKEQSKEYSKELQGIGGFETSVPCFIAVAGKKSYYREDEVNQFIVSSSIYAGYLTLALHLYGFGACIIQRNLLSNDSYFGNLLPKDEQVVCCLAVGNLKQETNVPLSHRIENIFKVIK